MCTHRHTHTHTNTQTHKHTNTQTHKHKNKHTHKHNKKKRSSDLDAVVNFTAKRAVTDAPARGLEDVRKGLISNCVQVFLTVFLTVFLPFPSVLHCYSLRKGLISNCAQVFLTVFLTVFLPRSSLHRSSTSTASSVLPTPPPDS